MASRGVFFPGLRSEGPSDLAHMHHKSRAKTRRMAPDARHDQKWCLCLRRTEHRAYDAFLLEIEALDAEAGADGPLRYRFNSTVREDAG